MQISVYLKFRLDIELQIAITWKTIKLFLYPAYEYAIEVLS